MPNGPTHRNLTKLVTMSSVPLYFYADPIVVTGILIGEIITLAINPDNDITINRVGIYKWLGFGLYNQLIEHRAGLRASNWREMNWQRGWKLLFFSHFPIIGTFLRFILVMYIPLLLLLIISVYYYWMINIIGGIFIGMCLSDLLHIVADIGWSGLKKNVRRI